MGDHQELPPRHADHGLALERPGRTLLRLAARAAGSRLLPGLTGAPGLLLEVERRRDWNEVLGVGTGGRAVVTVELSVGAVGAGLGDLNTVIIIIIIIIIIVIFTVIVIVFVIIVKIIIIIIVVIKVTWTQSGW